MNDVSTLQIRVLSSQVAEATNRLHALEKGARGAETATGGFTKSAGGMVKSIMLMGAGVGALGVAVAGLRSIVKTTAEFQALEGQLITATGSVEKATLAFQAIQDFAAQTPYDLKQATEGFTRLVNMGLTPSERAMRSYGNTASAMGKSMMQMIDAVADAATGEYERLKEFGIKTKREGDNISFTFQGVTTTVKNNAAEIEQYLMSIGENQFAGAMERQMETLNGAFSNLGDSWEILKNTIGEGGLGEGVEEAVRTATEAIESLNSYLASGEFEASMESWRIAFEGFAEAWSEGIDFIFNDFTETSRAAYDGFFDDSKGVWDDVASYLQAVPVMFTALVEEIATRLWGIVDAIAAVGKQMYDQFAADLNALIGLAKAAGTAIKEALKGNFSGAWSGLKADADVLMTRNVEASNKAKADYQNKIIANQAAVQGGVTDAFNKAADRLEGQEAARRDADQKRADYDAAADQRAKSREDRLAQFKVGADRPATTGGGGGGRSGGGGRGGSSGDREFEQLQRQLEREETAVEESYLRRLDLIRDNTQAGSQIQADLSLALVTQYEEQAMAEIDRNKRSLDTMWDAFSQEEALIEASYQKRKDIILSLTEATEQEKAALMDQAKQTYVRQIREHQREANSAYLGAAESFFNDISSIGDTFGKKGFKIAQAAAIAQATIKMYESATGAYAAMAGIPYVGPALGAVAAAGALAAGAANIAAIKSQQYSGAYAHGGMIPAGKTGLVGEAGPELISGPAVVTSAATTKDKMANGKGGNTIINIKNYTGEQVQTKETGEGDQKVIEFIIGQAEKRIADNIRKGGNGVARALESTYKMGRGGR